MMAVMAARLAYHQSTRMKYRGVLVPNSYICEVKHDMLKQITEAASQLCQSPLAIVIEHTKFKQHTHAQRQGHDSMPKWLYVN